MSMCRLNTVTRARKAQGKCGSCYTPIEPGDAYRWWRGRFGPKRVRCMSPRCTPAPWERETNPLRAEHMQAAAQVDRLTGYGNGDDIESVEEVADQLQSAIDTTSSVIDALQERVDGWQGTNLEYSYQAEACGMSLEELESWVSDAEGIVNDLSQLGEGETEEAADILGQLQELPDLDLGA